MGPSAFFSISEWLEILSSDYEPAKEQVIYIEKLPHNFELTRLEPIFSSYFPGYKSLKYQEKGDGVRIIGSKRVKQTHLIPDKIRSKIKLHPGDYVALTRENKFFWIKRFSIRKLTSEIPAIHHIIDDYSQSKVVRQIIQGTNALGDLPEFNEKILQQAPELYYDPLESQDEFGGFSGYLIRKEISRVPLVEDFSYEAEEIEFLRSTQNSRGDWNHNLAETAFNGIKLLYLGVDPGDFMIKSACHWLLTTPEPVGYPGLFMGTIKITERFNQWKAITPSGNLATFLTKEKKSNQFSELRDVFLNNLEISPLANELGLLSPSQIVIQFLLRCNESRAARVIRAINSLIYLNHDWANPHEILKISIPIPESDEAPKMNNIQIPRKYSEMFVLNGKSALTLDKPGERSVFVQLTNDRAIFEVIPRYKNDCSFEIHASLSFHPDYHMSKLEFLGACDLWNKQSSLGYFHGKPFSALFYFLGLNQHPLSRFMVIRALFQLRLNQEEDGIWNEEILSPFIKMEKDPQHRGYLSPENTQFRILNTLKAQNILEL